MKLERVWLAVLSLAVLAALAIVTAERAATQEAPDEAPKAPDEVAAGQDLKVGSLQFVNAKGEVVAVVKAEGKEIVVRSPKASHSHSAIRISFAEDYAMLGLEGRKQFHGKCETTLTSHSISLTEFSEKQALTLGSSYFDFLTRPSERSKGGTVEYKNYVPVFGFGHDEGQVSLSLCDPRGNIVFRLVGSDTKLANGLWTRNPSMTFYDSEFTGRVVAGYEHRHEKPAYLQIKDAKGKVTEEIRR